MTLRNALLFIFNFFFLFHLFVFNLSFPSLCSCVCRESVRGVSELGARGGFVSPASKAWPGGDTDRQHQSQAGLLRAGEPAAGPQ